MRSPCTSTLSRVVVCGSGLGPEATSAASAPAGTPSARLVSRVAAVRDCGDFVLGTACLRLLMWAMGVFVEWATRGRTHARWRRRASGTSWLAWGGGLGRSEEHTSELPSLMRISYAVFCLTKK